MAIHDVLATDNVQTMGNDAFLVYRLAVVACGVLLVGLAWWGFGAGVVARVISLAAGVVHLGYGFYLWFLVHEGFNEVYPFLFILPALVVGYQLYSRVENKELEAAVRAQLKAERAGQAERAEQEGPGGQSTPTASPGEAVTAPDGPPDEGHPPGERA